MCRPATFKTHSFSSLSQRGRLFLGGNPLSCFALAASMKSTCLPHAAVTARCSGLPAVMALRSAPVSQANVFTLYKPGMASDSSRTKRRHNRTCQTLTLARGWFHPFGRDTERLLSITWSISSGVMIRTASSSIWPLPLIANRMPARAPLPPQQSQSTRGRRWLVRSMPVLFQAPGILT